MSRNEYDWKTSKKLFKIINFLAWEDGLELTITQLARYAKCNFGDDDESDILPIVSKKDVSLISIQIKYLKKIGIILTKKKGREKIIKLNPAWFDKNFKLNKTDDSIERFKALTNSYKEASTLGEIIYLKSEFKELILLIEENKQLKEELKKLKEKIV